ncbi:hypothetical protein ONZ43_g7714 [Nemania bipapillata]|uniref:Uncharacterized protein n=1 Tax=Nemania bipapillata TaxID=110536 RepID=A0ACC2HNS1_9PEZI|nr:hypothetical protein ONZ43_g7714 [Nemania bipapillata]
MALGHEDLRRHENIVQLIAITWEIENVKDWSSKADITVWPVMILEKAELGDLGHFLRGKGVETDLLTRLRMCAGIASALAAVHQNGIVHGDIKPENALVFTGGVVKLSDFGFSARASNKLLELAGTYPWRAPEINSLDRATPQQGKLTDLYSFGMLCLWILFRNRLAVMGEIGVPPPLLRGSLGSLSSSDSSASSCLSTPRSDPVAQVVSDLEHLKLLNTANKKTNGMSKLAQDLVGELTKGKIRDYLGQLFARLLSFTASSRVSDDTAADFRQISQNLLDLSPNDKAKPINSVHATQKDNRHVPRTLPKASAFQVSSSLESLCQADFRVRKHIFDCLLQEYNEARNDDDAKAMLAVQLAFCKEVGFGTMKDSVTADTYRREGHIEAIQLQNLVDSTRTSQEPFNSRLRALCASGIIQPIHYGTDFRSVANPGVSEEIRKSSEAEIERMETVLGKTHSAILNLKWSLSAILMNSESRLGPVRHLHKMMQELHADPNHGPLHRHSLLTRGYFCLSLRRLSSRSTAGTIVAYSKETHSALVDHGLADHVLPLQISVQISDLLYGMGHLKESTRFFEFAQLGMNQKFGPEHGNTVMLLDKKTDHLVREGKLADALENIKDVSKRMEGLVDDGDDVKSYLRRRNATIFCLSGRFEEALGLIEDELAAMRARDIPEDHLAYLEGLMAKAKLLLKLGRFEEAAACARSMIQALRGMPWPLVSPPPYLRGDEGCPQNPVYSPVQELAELLGQNKMVTPEKGADC